METDALQNMGKNVKKLLKSCGNNVTIHPLAKIVKPEVVDIGNNSLIDDFTFIYGGKRIIIGKYVHLESFSSVIGGGELIVGDYAVIATGSRILTGTDTYHGGKRMTTALPETERNVVRGKIIMEKDSFIGTNCVVHPNVIIGEGAIVGSNSLVLKDVEPWSINVGSPSRKIGERPKIKEKFNEK